MVSFIDEIKTKFKVILNDFKVRKLDIQVNYILVILHYIDIELLYKDICEISDKSIIKNIGDSRYIPTGKSSFDNDEYFQFIYSRFSPLRADVETFDNIEEIRIYLIDHPTKYFISI
jgi:hypothetical protein